MRLDKLLARSGYGSRSEIKQMVRRGQILLAGQQVRDPGLLLTADTARQVTISGQAIRIRLHHHLLFNKPAGLITALQDKSLPTIASLLPDAYLKQGLVPVGRLDRDSTGLLLLTSDGTLNHRLASPRWQIKKNYLVSYEGEDLTDTEVAAFAQGLLLDGSELCQPALLLPGPAKTARIILREGKYHQVKRMLAAVERQVTGLHRTAFGPLVLDETIEPGSWRELTDSEIKALYKAVGLDQPGL